MKNNIRITAYLTSRKNKKGEMFYGYRYHDIDGSNPSESFGKVTKRQALEFLNKFNLDLNIPEVLSARAGGLTYKEYLKKKELARKAIERIAREFIDERLEYVKAHRAYKTWINYRNIFGQFKVFLSDNDLTMLSDISYETMVQFQTHLANDLKYMPATIATKMNSLRGIFTHAVNLDLINRSPMDKLDKIVIPEYEIKIFTEDELERFLNVIEPEDFDYFLMTRVAIDSAARPMELREIVRKKDIHFEKDKNTGLEYAIMDIHNEHVRTKNKKNRSTFISPSTCKILKPWLLQFRADEIIFAESDLSKGKKCKKFLELAGITDRTYYSIRRTALTRMADEKKIDIRELCTIAGHSTIETTRKYYLKIDARKIARKLADVSDDQKSYDTNDKKKGGGDIREVKAKYVS